jgi:hypothetical protein
MVSQLLGTGSGRSIMSGELCENLDRVLLVLPCHPRLQAAAPSDIGCVAMGPARVGLPDLVYHPMRK